MADFDNPSGGQHWWAWLSEHIVQQKTTKVGQLGRRGDTERWCTYKDIDVKASVDVSATECTATTYNLVLASDCDRL